jgi:hypothetical protein
VPEHMKTLKMCDLAVGKEPYVLRYVPEHMKTS